jgi:hypothetical protein
LNRLYQFTKIMYAIAIFLTYNLQFYVTSTLLWPRICRKILYKYSDKAKARFEHAFRIGLILITCKFCINVLLHHVYSISVTVAALIPNLGLVISLGISFLPLFR